MHSKNNNNNSPSQKSQSPTPEDLEKIKSHLTFLVNSWTNLHNARDYTGMLSVDYFCPLFTNISPHRHVKGQALSEYVSQYKDYIDSCPEFWVNITDISVEFRGQKALVMVDAEQRIEGGVTLPCFSVLSWVLDEGVGRWRCCKIDSMRGSAGGMEGVL